MGACGIVDDDAFKGNTNSRFDSLFQLAGKLRTFGTNDDG